MDSLLYRASPPNGNLVLTCKHGDGVSFPELGIRVTLVRLSGSRASLHVVAPIDVKVLRNHLMDKDQ